MTVYYEESTNSYVVIRDTGKRKSNGKKEYFYTKYSINRYGKYAEQLAYKAYHDMVKYKTLVERNDNVAIMKLYSKKYGYMDAYIDIIHADFVEMYKWYLAEDKGSFYVRHDKLGRLHRALLNLSNPSIKVDHKNRNTLNNLTQNLRPVNTEINNKNTKVYKSNTTTDIRGVHFDKYKEAYVATWTVGKKLKQRSYSINKYGREVAFEKAVKKRVSKMIEHSDYLVDGKLNLDCYKPEVYIPIIYENEPKKINIRKLT